jgi:hypothetical protein
MIVPRGRHANSTVASMCFLASVILVTPCAAVAARAADFSGTFRLVPEESDDIDAAIERAIRPMGFVIRPFARRRLRKINTPCARLTIGASADAVVVVGDAQAPIRTPLNGVPISWKREDGEPFTVSAAWDGGVFEQTFASGTGRRINRYSLSADGRMLTMHVAVSGGGLPGTLVYTLVYQRVA